MVPRVQEAELPALVAQAEIPQLLAAQISYQYHLAQWVAQLALSPRQVVQQRLVQAVQAAQSHVQWRSHVKPLQAQVVTALALAEFLAAQVVTAQAAQAVKQVLANKMPVLLMPIHNAPLRAVDLVSIQLLAQVEQMHNLVVLV
jgi:hypothetical protein